MTNNTQQKEDEYNRTSTYFEIVYALHRKWQAAWNNEEYDRAAALSIAMEVLQNNRGEL